MNTNIYVATFSENAIEVINKYGVNMEFNHLCISENLDRRERTLRQMKKDFAASNAQKAIVHGPFTEIIPASIDPRAVQLGLDRLNEAYDICKELGVKRMVVHTGYIPLLYYKQWHIEKSVKFWRTFLRDKPADFNIMIENVFEDEPYVMRNLIEAIDDKRATICLDVGHANAMTDKEINVETWAKVLAPYVTHMHIHNNFGSEDEHNPIDKGNMDIKKIVEIVRQAKNPQFSMTVESRQCESTVKALLT